jgi:VirE N-terminal domain
MESLNTIWTSLYVNRYTAPPVSRNVLDFLTTADYKSIVEKYRKGEIKGNSFPCITTSAICEGMHGTDNAKQMTGLICLDIDGDHNPHVTDWIKFIFSLQWMPEIFFIGLSRSGNGCFIIMPLQSVTKENYIEYFLHLQKWFADNYYIKIDPSCKNISRLRYASYNTEETSWYNTKALPWRKKIKLPEPKAVSLPGNIAGVDEEATFKNLVKWVEKSILFVPGSGNTFTLKLSGACCRFNIPIESAIEMINDRFWVTAPDYNEYVDKWVKTVHGSYKYYILGSALK